MRISPTLLAARYRQNAAMLRRIAKDGIYLKTRDSLLQMANNYDAMAYALETKSRVPKPLQNTV